MLSMVDTLTNFVEWAQALMNQKNISQADIARTGYVTRTAVSKLFTFQVKTVGVEMCKAIAAATNIPLEIVYSKAGLLPPLSLTEEEQHQIAALTAQLNPEMRKTAISLLESLTRQQYTSQTTPQPKNAH